MIETSALMRYHNLMKHTSLADILTASWNDLLGSLDMRPRPSQPPVLRRGQTVENAWAATGMYLRRAIDQHGPNSPSPSRRSR